MKFFIDTANLQEIKEANALGILDGVTTNPSLIAKEGKDFEDQVREICKIVNGPISAEVVSVESGKMVQEGRKLAKIHPNVVIKCPLTLEGLKATKTLSGEGHQVNVTLCFSANQALLAAKAGAAYISPFIGRLDDVGQVGMELIADIRQIYDNYGFKTEILAASIRHPIHVLEAAKIGADVATMPYTVLMSLVKHPLTDIGLAKFLKDWEKAPQRQLV
ncbi:MAG: fructose-6-phosphate aldolase [Candidatus Omnitrophica bacterium]|nr:fructose-6-phosphate aldolase [Candidatus Omnitrophota bacterium]